VFFRRKPGEDRRKAAEEQLLASATRDALFF